MLRSRAARGFTLFEVMVVIIVSGLVLSALFAGMVMLLRSMQPQAVKIGSDTLPIAPSFGGFPSAVRLHQTFTERVGAARATYVLGGKHLTVPTNAPEAAVQPLQMMGLPTINDFSAGLPTNARTFYETYSNSLGPQETQSSVDDFTIVIVGPYSNSLAVTCMVQVRRVDTAISDGSESTHFIVRDVRLWDIDIGATRTVRYAFAERPALAAKTYIGAVHTWMRYQMNAVAEEGPACVVFPDPWLYAGARGRSDDIPPFSRFSYFLPVSP